MREARMPRGDWTLPGLWRRTKTKLQFLRNLRRWRRNAEQLGLEFLAPNFIFYDWLDSSSVIVDGGCGFEADLSVYLIRRYGLQAFGVDPTQKHAPPLARIERRTRGRFKHLPFAMAPETGTMVFHESVEAESGSALADHRNIADLTSRSYSVRGVSLADLPAETGTETIDLLKLDIEGLEYELLGSVDPEALMPYTQIFVEFHGHVSARFSQRDTDAVVDRLCSMGLQAVTVDGGNYLFVRKPDAAVGGQPTNLSATGDTADSQEQA